MLYGHVPVATLVGDDAWRRRDAIGPGHLLDVQLDSGDWEQAKVVEMSPPGTECRVELDTGEQRASDALSHTHHRGRRGPAAKLRCPATIHHSTF